MNHYYYDQLNKEEQHIYHLMKTGLLALAPSFHVPRLEAKTLYDIYFKIRLDQPEIFYTVKFNYRFYPQADSVEIIPEYLFDKNKIRTHQQAMKARVEKLVRPALKMTELEKELYIHDFICQNVRYDKLKKPYSHEIIGPLGQGVGVCEGIAKTVKILCDALGIWCVIPICGNNPEKGIKYRHTWNIVCIGGTYYHLDVTFDNSLGKDGELRYDYFNLDDGQIFRDHEPLLWHMPVCSDHEHFYYKEKKLSFTKMEDIRKRSAQAVKKNKILTFHWRGGFLTKEVLKEILQIFQEEAEAKGKHAKVSLNWPQAVIRVRFEENLAEECVEMQEANEGELEI